MKRLFVVALCLILFPTLAWAAEPTQVPTADFFRPAAVGQAVMSPAGRFVAITMKGGPKGRRALVVLDVSDLSKAKPLALFADGDVVNVNWVNEDRLVFGVTDFQAPSGEFVGAGLYVVPRDGSAEPRNLIRRGLANEDQFGMVASRGSRIAESGLSVFHRLHSIPGDGSNDVLLTRLDYSDKGEFTGTALLRLDTLTANVRLLSLGAPGGAWIWLADAKGNPRAVVTQRDKQAALHWKPAPDAPWRQVRTWAAYGGAGEGWNPVGIGQGDELYVAAKPAGGDVSQLMLADMSRTEPGLREIMSHNQFDFEGELIRNAEGRILGIQYQADAAGTHWLDEKLKSVQQAIDRALPGQINEISCGRCTDFSHVLVRSFSDRQPSVFRLFDVRENKLKALTAARPWISAAAMGPRNLHWIEARDGLKLPVWVTRPADKKGPLPAVVLVHGGPYAHGGTWRWVPEVQFLASRGYVVIEPDFRGTLGLGFKHFQAGWKQWGLAMQDDLADAVSWSVKAGLADRDRICIAGASYGGYASMMGLVRHEELYRCAVNWVGATDFDLLYTARWSDFSAVWKEYGMPVLIGDREKDARQLEATSPLKQAAKIRKPVLLAYGGSDTRVPILHGVALRKALEAHNRDVEWIEYKDEGHGWRLEANQVDFWNRVDKFLARHLK
jgi:dipeptidyl aminopeptidase/acylaminoacyl peptidase